MAVPQSARPILRLCAKLFALLAADAAAIAAVVVVVAAALAYL